MASPEELVRRTLARYCHLCDDGRFAEWGALFTEDARLHVLGTTHTGRDAVRGFIEAAQPPERRGRHAVVNSLVLVELDDGGGSPLRARAWSDYLFLDRSGAVTNTGRYHDELVPGVDGVWRFELREIVFAGGEPELTGPPPA